MYTAQNGLEAPGGPGKPATWSAARKSVFLGLPEAGSRVWFTLYQGILSEVFYPTLDQPQLHSLEWLISDGATFAARELELEYRVQSKEGECQVECRDDARGYRLNKKLLLDGRANRITIEYELRTRRSDLNLFVVCNPHLDNEGNQQNACVLRGLSGEVLAAERGRAALALAGPFLETSCGYAGVNDGLTDLCEKMRLVHHFTRARQGNVILSARVEPRGSLCLGFGQSRQEALNQLYQPATTFREHRVEPYLHLHPQSCDGGLLYEASLRLFRMATDKTYLGANPASPCVPWGDVHGDKSRGGYHLVWSRDLCKQALGMLAAGWREQPLRSLAYLCSAQNETGCFPQNFWMDGTVFRDSVQLDEVAFPVLLAARLRREQALQGLDPYEMVAAAADYMVTYGPFTEQDRWEESSGLSPPTLAVCIAALLEAAGFAGERGQLERARLWEEQADFYEENLENWLVTRRGSLLEGIREHYVRINPGPDPQQPGRLRLANQPADVPAEYAPSLVISTGFLDLVRYGIRRPNDPLIEASLRLVDARIRVGHGWYRYNHDGYGETREGGGFQGFGRGRLWPLLTGERALYELAAGRPTAELVQAMESFAGPELLLSEQVWDEGPRKGQPTGSARPLLWAHAEYLQLLRSRQDGQSFALVARTSERYLHTRPSPPPQVWCRRCPLSRLLPGRVWRIVDASPFRLHWSLNDEWQERNSQNLGSLHWVDLEVPKSQRQPLQFTFYWHAKEQWEGRDFLIKPMIRPVWGQW